VRTAYDFDHQIDGLENGRPLIIAHRGSSGVRPAHSISGYELAIEHGTDIIECDLAVTKDLVLVCLHDEFLSTVTNVSSMPEFAERQRRIGTRMDWFTTDFTLAEIKTIGLIQERGVRDQSFNNQFHIPTFEEYIKGTLLNVGTYFSPK